MIPVEYYTWAFYITSSFIIILACLPLLQTRLADFPRGNLIFGSIALLIVTIGFIGLRDPYGHWQYFGDTGTYTRTYNFIQQNIRTEFDKDLGFYAFMKICSQIMDITGFYLTTAILYVGLPYITFKKWFGKYAFFALAMFVASMSFWAFGINGVRNGLASSIFIFALAFRDRKWLLILLMLLSISFHKSMVLPVLAYLLTFRLPNTKLLLWIWILCIPVSLFAGQIIESWVRVLLMTDTMLGDARADTYFSGETGVLDVSQTFRWDFVLYSAAPILLGVWFIFKKGFDDALFLRLFHTYVLINAVWIVLIYVPYTNRLAYLSWFLMPLLFSFPLLRRSLPAANKYIISTIIVSIIFLFIIS